MLMLGRPSTVLVCGDNLQWLAGCKPVAIARHHKTRSQCGLSLLCKKGSGVSARATPSFSARVPLPFTRGRAATLGYATHCRFSQTGLF
jgi:hypothetical protein